MRDRLLLLLALAQVCGAANYEVSGVVVDSQSQKPLANVRVLLAPTTMRVQKLERVTKQDGRFSFVVSVAGKYTLQIAKPGYPLQSYRQASFGAFSSAIAVRDDQDTSHIVFPASRGGVIYGVVKDEDSEPVDNALVTIFQSLIVDGERKILPRGQARANGAGEFRLAGLLRGNYYICAMGRPWFADSLIQQEVAKSPQYSADPAFRGTAFVTTFYPRAQTIEEAGLVRLDTGGEVQASITLPLIKAVTVKGAIASSGEMSTGRAVLLKKIYDQYVSFLEARVSKEGAFEFKNVPAGSYQIMATSDSGSGASSWNVSQDVEVGASDLEVTLRPRSMGALSGRVLFEGEPPASRAGLFIMVRNDKGNMARIQVDPEGNFSLSRILPGRYEVSAGSAEYVASYFAGPSGEHLPLTLEIASAETIHRDLMLTKAVSVIEGTAQNAGMPQVGAFILLMPKNPSERWAYRFDQTDSDGSFRLATIPAGDYFLIALSDGVDVAYRDAKVAALLAKAAKPVHIDAGEHLDLKIDIAMANSSK
jgi:Carboxypeptidase regulatory-like domain